MSAEGLSLDFLQGPLRLGVEHFADCKTIISVKVVERGSALSRLCGHTELWVSPCHSAHSACMAVVTQQW